MVGELAGASARGTCTHGWVLVECVAALRLASGQLLDVLGGCCLPACDMSWVHAAGNHPPHHHRRLTCLAHVRLRALPYRYGGRMPERQAVEMVLLPCLKVLSYLHEQVRAHGAEPQGERLAGEGSRAGHAFLLLGRRIGVQAIHYSARWH